MRDYRPLDKNLRSLRSANAIELSRQPWALRLRPLRTDMPHEVLNYIQNFFWIILLSSTHKHYWNIILRFQKRLGCEFFRQILTLFLALCPLVCDLVPNLSVVKEFSSATCDIFQLTSTRSSRQTQNSGLYSREGYFRQLTSQSRYWSRYRHLVRWWRIWLLVRHGRSRRYPNWSWNGSVCFRKYKSMLTRVRLAIGHSLIDDYINHWFSYKYICF